MHGIDFFFFLKHQRIQKVVAASLRVDVYSKTPNEVTATSSAFNWDFNNVLIVFFWGHRSQSSPELITENNVATENRVTTAFPTP